MLKITLKMSVLTALFKPHWSQPVQLCLIMSVSLFERMKELTGVRCRQREAFPGTRITPVSAQTGETFRKMIYTLRTIGMVLAGSNSPYCPFALELSPKRAATPPSKFHQLSKSPLKAPFCGGWILHLQWRSRIWGTNMSYECVGNTLRSPH